MQTEEEEILRENELKLAEAYAEASRLAKTQVTGARVRKVRMHNNKLELELDFTNDYDYKRVVDVRSNY